MTIVITNKDPKAMWKSVINHCRKHGITMRQETHDGWEFEAPMGTVFSTEAYTRFVELDWGMTARELVDLLNVDERAPGLGPDPRA